MVSHAKSGGRDTGDEPDQGLIGSQRLRAAMAAIDGMPPLQREIFLLHRMNEMSYREIARRTGVSIKSVEKHMRLAIKDLACSVG